MTFEEIKKQVKDQQQTIDTLGKMLARYPNVDDWVYELLVNHPRSAKTQRMLKAIAQANVVFHGSVSWQPDIDKAVAQEFIKEVHRRIPSRSREHQDLSIMCEDNDFNRSPRLILINDWRAKVGIDSLHADFRLRVNLPPLSNHHQLNINMMADSVYGIQLPFNWGSGFLKFNNGHVNMTAELLSIYDDEKTYINYDGAIMEAQQCYHLLRVQEDSLPWRKKMFKDKLPDYDSWVSQQRVCKFNVNDDDLYHQVATSQELQERAIEQLIPLNNKIAKQFNIVFHDLLNYPAFDFGAYHLKFPREEE